jgi:polygalacturonase
MLKNNTLSFLFLAITLFCCLNSSTAASSTYNVIKFGAKPDGKTDSTKAFLNAWTKACSSPYPATIYVPQGKFLLGTATFSGKCTNKAISITIDGTLVASSDYRVTGKSGNWLKFQHVDGISIRGGVLDGQGTALWDCKNSDKNNCPTGATVMFIMHWQCT